MRNIGGKLVIATHNPGKLREIAALMEPLGIQCVGAEELGFPDPEEIGNTFVDNADLKAREAADLSGLPALVDDSGLAVDALHGMLGISYVGYCVQERGMAWFWYLMAMVSVNLAVANFLPLPIVDGGLFLLLILEKIRGKPLSLKVQSAIQVVGIVLLAGMFLFVTYNDIFLFLK